MSIHICHCISRSCISASLYTCKSHVELNPQSTRLTISKLPPVRFWSGLSSTLVYAFTINTQQITGILIFVLGFHVLVEESVSGPLAVRHCAVLFWSDHEVTQSDPSANQLTVKNNWVSACANCYHSWCFSRIWHIF